MRPVHRKKGKVRTSYRFPVEVDGRLHSLRGVSTFLPRHQCASAVRFADGTLSGLTLTYTHTISILDGATRSEDAWVGYSRAIARPWSSSDPASTC